MTTIRHHHPDTPDTAALTAARTYLSRCEWARDLLARMHAQRMEQETTTDTAREGVRQFPLAGD